MRVTTLYWPYGTIFWTLGGGYASAVAVGFSVVTAKTVVGTTKRWIAILSMELMLVLPSLTTYLVGEIIGKYRITGILWLLWSFIILTFLTALLVTFKFREDSVQVRTIIESGIGLFKGMKKIWFSVDPGFFVGPITLTFTLYTIAYGSFMILVLYLRYESYIFLFSRR